MGWRKSVFLLPDSAAHAFVPSKTRYTKTAEAADREAGYELATARRKLELDDSVKKQA